MHIWGGAGGVTPQPNVVVKEGLSEMGTFMWETDLERTGVNISGEENNMLKDLEVGKAVCV